ncbi:MAG: zinc metallopeptidase [Oscillospiraceae bacterium]|jgi:Zn-dependent membrane protease YugP
MFYVDPWYLILVLPAILFGGFAQMKISSTYRRYAGVQSRRGITASFAADSILRRNGVSNVSLERIGGRLSDHYDPRSQTIRLSSYDSQSVADIGVAAHEAGHAIQYAQNYFPIRLRAAILPITAFGSSVAPILILVGLLLYPPLFLVGILLFAVVTLFQLVTLPVELDASRRAMAALEEQAILTDDELIGAKKVLSAAALTYLAALLVSIANLLRLILLFSGRQQRRN